MQLLAPSASRTYTPLTDETRLSQNSQSDPVSSRQSTPSELDLGELRRGPSRKGKEKAWDEEMGPVEEVDSYPPVNQADQEERRVQDVSLRWDTLIRTWPCLQHETRLAVEPHVYQDKSRQNPQHQHADHSQ
jgi:hypothetical protein